MDQDNQWSHDLVETLIADSRDALVVVDRDQHVLAANAGWYLLSGEKPDAVLGRKFRDILKGDDPSEMAGVVDQAVSLNVPVAGPIVHRHTHGFDLKLDALVTPIYGRAGDVVVFLGRLRPAAPSLVAPK